jgi:sugar phosphate isomerase/epimerase
MPRENLKLAVVASAFSPDPRVAPQMARRAKFNGLLFDARSASLDIPEMSATGLREFRHLLGAQDQQLVGLHHDLGSKGLGPTADVDRELATLRRVMEAAKGLGSPLVTVDLGPLPAPVEVEPPKPKVTPDMAGLILLPTAAAVDEARRPATPTRPPLPPPDPAVLSQIDAALVEIGRLADRTSVILAFRSELSSLSALERALRAADCPWFGVDLDPAAVLGDAWDLDETFSRLGPQVRHVRGRDAIRGADRRTKPAVVGQGDTDWPQLLANLDGADYGGWITVDPLELPDRAGAAAAALSHLLSVG